MIPMTPTVERDRTMTHTTEKDLNSMIQATVRDLNLIPMTQATEEGQDMILVILILAEDLT